MGWRPGTRDRGRATDELSRWTDGELVAGLSSGLFGGSGRQFQNRMRGQTGGCAPGRDTVPDLANLVLFVQVYEVYGEFHEESVHRFAGSDPQAFARIELSMFQQAGATLGAGVGDLGVSGQHGAARQIANLDLQASSVTHRAGF